MRVNRTLLDRAHALTGAVPLALYLVFHLAETWPALAGRAAWNARFVVSASPAWLLAKGALVLLPLAVHASLGLRRIALAVTGREPEDERASRVSALGGTKGLRTLHWVTGLLTLGFCAVHLAQLWLPLVRGDVGSPWLYEGLTVELGQPVWIVVQVVGLTAVCFHVGQGLPAALVHLGLVDEAAAFRRVRIGCAVLAVVLWALLVDVTSHFATGAALVGERTPRLPTTGDVETR